jgi:drug/metabolite transporter (DMT)-like permease
MQDQTYQRGVLYIVVAGIFLSTGGLFIRSVENASPWTVLFYRSLTFTVTVVLFLLARDRKTFVKRFQALSAADLIISMSLALGFITYVLSLFNTSVANTVLILSTGPVFAALLGWLVLREKVTMVTWLAILMAFSGVAVMVSGGIAASDKLGYDLFRNDCHAETIPSKPRHDASNSVGRSMRCSHVLVLCANSANFTA